VRETNLSVAAHLTCLGESSRSLHETLQYLKTLGINRLVALRGDAAAETIIAGKASERASTFNHAIELVELAAEMGGFDISVAAYPETHPQALSTAADIQFLKAKLDAGASRAITQFFFDNNQFLHWRDRVSAAGVDKPIVAGILPIHDINRTKEFAARCGTSVPDSLFRRFNRVKGMAGHYQMAVDIALQQCAELQREGVENFHLYTLNQSDLALCIGRELCANSPVTAAA